MKPDHGAPVDRARSVIDYRALAAGYDRRTRLIDRVRLRAAQALAPRPGETVLDAGCGSGFAFAPIEAAIGERGRLLAFDQSPELLAIARARVVQAGWRNVALQEGAAENVRFDASADALLLSYVHDVMQTEAALDNLLSQAKAGARVVACGSVLWPWWGWPVNAWLRGTAATSRTSKAWHGRGRSSRRGSRISASKCPGRPAGATSPPVASPASRWSKRSSAPR